MDIEINSPTWRRVKDAAQKGIESSRAKIEQSGFGHDITQFERGKLKAYREILALADAPTVIPE